MLQSWVHFAVQSLYSIAPFANCSRPARRFCYEGSEDAIQGVVKLDPLACKPPGAATLLPENCSFSNFTSFVGYDPVFKSVGLWSRDAFQPATVATVSAADPLLQYVGRFEVSGGDRMFDFAGSEIRARLVLGAPSNVAVALAQRHFPHPQGAEGNTQNSGFQSNSFVVFINGTRQGAGGYNATFSTSAAQQDDVSYDFSLCGAPLPAGTHDIRVVKATEPDWNGGDPLPNYMRFSGFRALPSARMRAAALPPPPLRRLEFLGDSITAGFCNECEAPARLPGDHEEAFLASWDYRVGEMLGASVHTVAWSGLGMVRNCCGGNTTMPSIFSRTLATVNRDGTWDFGRWVPDALVVNLGTNDGDAATDPRFDYVGVYADLVATAAQRYGIDKLQVFVACGPMSETYCGPVQAVLANLTSRGVRATFLDQRGYLNGTFGPGCCGHPSIEVDEAIAESAAAVIRRTLDW